MEYTVIYSMIFVFCFVLFLLLKPSNVFLIILAEYTIIGIASVACIYFGYIETQDIKLWPYLYSILVIIICILPFKSYNTYQSQLNINLNDSAIYFFMTIYILLSVVAVHVFWPYVSSLLASQDWNTNRDFLYTNDVIIVRNRLEWLAINFTSYFQIPALIISFLLICADKAKMGRKLLLIFTTLTVSMKAMYGSSRGILLDYLLLILAMFFVFKKWMPRKRVIIISSILSIIALASLLYSIDVTVSRFGTRTQFGNNSAIGSLIYYFGHSPIIFNAKISRAKDMLMGGFVFGPLLSILGINSFNKAALGIDWGTSFYTFVGYFYIDWGIIGTLALVICLSYRMYMIMNSKKISISSLYSVFFYYSFLEKGAFVIGRAFIIEFSVYIFIHFFIKFYESRVEESRLRNNQKFLYIK